MQTTSYAASPHTKRASSSIAIVGGGITGSIAASELSQHFQNVIVMDQGRRGPGGRASHRSVLASNDTVIDEVKSESDVTYEFDHGCQFFRADSQEMQTLVSKWMDSGFVSPWNARFGTLDIRNSKNKMPSVDFFGIPSHSSSHVYVGTGGMHQLPRRILEECSKNVVVHSGTRVSRIEKGESNTWELYGTSGIDAFHDTKDEDESAQIEEPLLACVDAVLFTDVSSSFESWHRASANVPDALRKQLSNHLSTKVRVPLFSCMVALKSPIGHSIPYDGFTVSDVDSPLWFASCSQSKPDFFPHKTSETKECWTLISTPEYAFRQIRETPMRDEKTGKFLVQDNEYLNSIPGPDLFYAFREAVESHWKNTNQIGKISVELVYLQAQRWGSGLPVDESLATNVEEVLGTTYATGLKKSLVYPSPILTDEETQSPQDFVADDELRLYYAGDFCSQRNPGFEASSLSGFDAARHIIASYEEKGP